jgi:hypothetical protein
MPKKFGPAGDCRHLKVGTLKVKLYQMGLEMLKIHQKAV